MRHHLVISPAAPSPRRLLNPPEAEAVWPGLLTSQSAEQGPIWTSRRTARPSTRWSPTSTSTGCIGPAEIGRMGENVCWHVEVRRYDRAMAGYEPVTIEAVCNAGVDALEDAAGDLPLGRVELRGLPFLVGSDTPSKERCFVVPTAPVSIEVGRTARRVIIAHRLLKPGGPAGHGVGTPVADYVFHLAGGEAVTVPIRERFEIQVVPMAWGSSPFLAVADSHDSKAARFEGHWDGSGFRLAEHGRGWARTFYLWCWENPQPDAVVERIELIPRDLPFLVAGITLGQAEEHPFVRTPSRPVRLVVTDPDLAGRDDVLDVVVDRGVATYPHQSTTTAPATAPATHHHRPAPPTPISPRSRLPP
jgi:hypothetical protein